MTTIVAVCLVTTLLLSARAAQPEYCKLPPEISSCGAAVQRYYYNPNSQNCEQFTYGGCQGNKNRFSSIQDCLDVCKINHTIGNRGPARLKPGGRNRTLAKSNYDFCPADKLAGLINNVRKIIGLRPLKQRLSCKNNSRNDCLRQPETGPCRANDRKFYYNVSTGTCEAFIYGGCLGNGNIFDTQQKCQERCKDIITPPSGSKDACILPPETGICRAYVPQFFYNATSQMCEEFIYGGCGGNYNKFNTQQDCQERCNGTLPPSESNNTCILPPETGPCRAAIPKFYYNASTGTCEEFIYGGCQGNDNRFDTQEECQSRCKSTSLQPSSNNTCFLPPESGPCYAYIPQYFYNTTSQMCESFIYGGCRGNDNRFETQKDCEERCNKTLPPTASSYTCFLPPETGDCRAAIPKFYYNASTGTCKEFTYGGCLGNDNRFDTQEECLRACQNTSPPTGYNLCFLPAETGPCRAYFPRYFYNTTSRTCEKFIYGGCRGNDNRFETEVECQNQCRDTEPISSLDLPAVCSLPAVSGMCLAYFEKFFFNITSGKCEMFVYGGCGGNGNRFDSETDCETNCSVRTLPVSESLCLQQPETGPCKALIPRFYYNATKGMCEEFIYGGCQGNDNRFDTQQDCQERCNKTLTPSGSNNTCTLPPETGPCRAAMPKFYYNASTGTCEKFIYGGCQGNDNRFDTQEACLGVCQNTSPPTS